MSPSMSCERNPDRKEPSKNRASILAKQALSSKIGCNQSKFPIYSCNQSNDWSILNRARRRRGKKFVRSARRLPARSSANIISSARAKTRSARLRSSEKSPLAPDKGKEQRFYLPPTFSFLPGGFLRVVYGCCLALCGHTPSAVCLLGLPGKP